MQFGYQTFANSLTYYNEAVFSKLVYLSQTKSGRHFHKNPKFLPKNVKNFSHAFLLISM
jgi:hypothetical protein